MAWRITIGGHTLDEPDVTAEHILTVSEMTGRDEWSILDPTETPKTLIAWVALTLAIGSGQEVPIASAFIKSRPMTEVFAAIGPIPDPIDQTEANGTQPPPPSEVLHPSVAAMRAALHGEPQG